jgi:hypothetical protein
MTYNELRAALKDLRDNHGATLKTKLGGKGVTRETLQAEYDRLTTPKPTAKIYEFRSMAPKKRRPKAQGFGGEKRYDQLTIEEWRSATFAFLDDDEPAALAA